MYSDYIFCFVLIDFIKGLNITVVLFRAMKMFHWYIYFLKKVCVGFCGVAFKRIVTFNMKRCYFEVFG